MTNFPLRSKTNSLPYRVGIEGQLSSDLFIYAKYGTAAKDGAINLGSGQLTPVSKEKVATAEVGAKAWFFDRKLRVNVAAFSSDYTDLQISQLVGVSVALANAPKARINGAEIEIEARPAEPLRLTFNAGYLDPKFREFINTPTTADFSGVPTDLRGNQLPNVPKWSISAGATYTGPAIGGVVPELSAQYLWRDRVYFDEFNTIANSQKPIGTLDLFASLKPEAKGPWRLYGFVRNVTNKTVIAGSTGYAGILGAMRAFSYAPPRQFGVGLSLAF
ncbi:TonB-dependent receptor domain-containing protein [Sphingobium sp. AP50]|uniref:TonB-dependent receptor domain-containing protein n=1 Tax=Sphingobium sp. AP50 TaxID=1884369 RepID=UPI0015A724E8|nr:TonB-dependent receptor [Sphingobium sp. AP50]